MYIRVISLVRREMDWQSMDSPCREHLLSMEAVYKVCGTTGLWAVFTCAIGGCSVSSGEKKLKQRKN